MSDEAPDKFQWLGTGNDAFSAMLQAIQSAQTSIRLEMYTYQNCDIGRMFLTALCEASRRGVAVRVLVDAWGSKELPNAFWQPLREAGADFRWFNPFHLERVMFRDHRKLLVCDKSRAYLGGMNIGQEYVGDGVSEGWRDLELEIEGKLCGELAAAFDDMFERADFRHKHFMRLRKSPARKQAKVAETRLLLSGPGRGVNPIKRCLYKDVARAENLQIITAYFIPPWRLRRKLAGVARRGGRAQLILASKSDVPMAVLAARSLYQPLLRSGVEIYEYQPQVLHAKLVIADDIVYSGSANLDARSMRINYELMARIQDPDLKAAAEKIFNDLLPHCHRVDPKGWNKSRTLWNRLRERFAYLFLIRFDPYIAQYQLRRMMRNRSQSVF